MFVIPERTLKLIHKSLQLASYCKTIPYKWNPQFEKFESLKSKEILYWYLNFLFQFLGTTFSTSRLFYGVSLGLENVPLMDLAFVTYQVCGFALGVVFQIFIYFFKDEMLHFLNLCFKTRGTKVNRHNRSDPFYHLIVCVIPAVYMQSVCNIFLFLARPNSIQYIYPLLGKYGKSLIGLALVSGYEFLIPMNSWNSVLFMFLCYASYTHYLGCYLDVWSLREKALHYNSQGIISKNTIMKKVLKYRTIQILNTMYNECYGTCNVTLSMANLWFLLSWMIFASIRLYEVTTMPSYLIFPLGSFALFVVSFTLNEEGKRMFEASKYLIDVWTSRKYLKIYAKSMRPVRSEVGEFYYFKRASSLVFSSNVVNLTINFLFTF